VSFFIGSSFPSSGGMAVSSHALPVLGHAPKGV
jgi:hypothetical protein